MEEKNINIKDYDLCVKKIMEKNCDLQDHINTFYYFTLLRIMLFGKQLNNDEDVDCDINEGDKIIIIDKDGIDNSNSDFFINNDDIPFEYIIKFSYGNELLQETNYKYKVIYSAKDKLLVSDERDSKVYLVDKKSVRKVW